jgi:hypothetical protein
MISIGEYIGDIVMKDKQVFCALTIADAPGKIEKIEFEKALVNVLIIIHRG